MPRWVISVLPSAVCAVDVEREPLLAHFIINLNTDEAFAGTLSRAATSVTLIREERAAQQRVKWEQTSRLPLC